MRVISADIGGTNARIAILEDMSIQVIKTYPTKEFKSAAWLFERFSTDAAVTLPGRAGIAAAGPVEDGVIMGTNIGWDIDCSEIADILKLDTCILLNDFEAAAWGLLAIEEKDIVQIGGKAADPLGPKALLGAGTGLGEAMLLRCRNIWQVLRTEGGHASFSPRNRTEVELLESFMSRYGHVSFERFLSGSGLAEIYEFLAGERGIDRDTPPGHDMAAFITRGASEGRTLCVETLEVFCSIYGGEASNLALKCLSTGGVYLSGGIVQHIPLPFLKGSFRTAFEDKGRMSALLKCMPVFLVTHPFLGILGAAYRVHDMGGGS